jgi:ankyrin repeat protein
MIVKTFDQWIDLVGKGNIKDIENEILNNKNILNLQDNNIDTALLVSLKNGLNDIAKLLIDKGADLNLQDNNKDTDLFHAVRSSNDNIELVKLLIEKGADKDYIKTSYGDYNKSTKEYIGNGRNFKNLIKKDISENFPAIDIIKTTYTYNFNILRIAKDLSLQQMINYLKSLKITELFH